MTADQNQTAGGAGATQARGPRPMRGVITAIILAAAAMALGIGYLRKRGMEELTATPTGKARADIMYLERLVRHYTRVVGDPPTNEQGLQALVQMKVVAEIPKDPWGRPYLYRSARGVGRVTSLGRDGVPGGEGEDADVEGVESKGP